MTVRTWVLGAMLGVAVGALPLAALPAAADDFNWKQAEGATLRVLLDSHPWQEALEEIIRTVRSSAVLVGKDGLGPWEEPEMRASLSESVRRGLPVIPVLLPGASAQPVLPLFLTQYTWVDLRQGVTEEGLDRLEWGITGVKPGGKGKPEEK